jgi:hypothetical protein
MDMEKATPQQIADYKNSWMKNAYPVRLHSDLDVKGKDWCRKYLDRWQWKMNTWTDVYEHTFYFEWEKDSIAFKENFGKFADQESIK